jgi:hypothetical protein
MENKSYATALKYVLAMMFIFQLARPDASAACGLFQDWQGKRSEDQELPEREEINRSYNIAAGSTVEVANINGSVEIKTVDGGPAQVQIISSARSREDLLHHRIVIENLPKSLTIRGESQRGNDQGISLPGAYRQRLRLMLPRQVDLTIRTINGPVSIGEIDGQAQVRGVNGVVAVAYAAGVPEIRGVNGSVKATVKGVNERGMRVSGVTGAVELRFVDDLNADLSVSGALGISAQLPNILVKGRQGQTGLRAQIGAGGPLIMISKIMGGVKLSRSA